MTGGIRLVTSGTFSPLIERAGHSVAEAAAQGQAGPAFQHDELIAVRPGFEIPDPVQIDDHGAVNSREPGRVEAGLDLFERGADQVGAAFHVQLEIITGRLDPFDLLKRKESRTIAFLDEKPLHPRPGRRRLLERAGQTIGQFLRLAVGQLFPGALDGEIETVRRDRLEQVVQRPLVEGLDRVVVERRHEDYVR